MVIKKGLLRHSLADFCEKGRLDSWDQVLIPSETFFALSGREIKKGDPITFNEPDLPICLSKTETLHGWLIPKPSHNISLAKMLTIDSWGEVRKQFLAATKNVCVGCGVTNITLDAHEVWEFPQIHNNIDTGKLQPQTLISIVPLCDDCHTAAHANKIWGLVDHATKLDRALQNEELFIAPLQHLQKINLWADQTMFNYKKFLLGHWRQTSAFNFFLNCKLINDLLPDLVLEVQEEWELDGVLLRKKNKEDTKTVLVGVKWKLENEQQIHFLKERI